MAHAHTELALEYAEALLDTKSHPSDSKRVLQRALAEGVPAMTLYVDVLPLALYEVGRRWQHGKISVAAEHLATLTVRDALRDLARRLPRQPRNRRSVVVAAVEGELHDLGARIVADLLDADGWEVYYVGAALPADALGWLVRERRPDAVALSATLSTHVPIMAAAIEVVRRGPDPAPYILVGGQACSTVRGLRERIGADAVALRADEAVARLAHIAQATDDAALAESLSAREQEVLALLAQGLTNQEIAARLSLSTATVKTHVGNVLRKLGLRNRSEAAVSATRRAIRGRGVAERVS